MPKDWNEAFKVLDGFREFEKDWDGEGSDPPDECVVRTAERIARRLSERTMTPPHRIFVGVNAIIYFEWVTDSCFIEIGVDEGNRAEILLANR